MGAVAGASGSYAQYKNDTAAFLTWLLQAAQACGYELTPSGCPLDATKQHSDVSVTVSNLKVPVREIVEQARRICASLTPILHIPRAIARFAQRAIDARRSFSARFSAASSAEMQAQTLVTSNETHEFFTDALAEALRLLNEHRSAFSSQASHEACNETQDPITKLANPFAVLEVEDCEDSAQALAQLDGKVQNKNASSDNQQAKMPDTSKQPDEDLVDAYDICLRLSCFFIDLNELRAQVGEAWKLYQKGALALIPAAMTSNAAIALVEQMEKDLLESLRTLEELKEASLLKHASFDSPYEAILGILCTALMGYEYQPDPYLSCAAYGQFLFADISFILAKLRDGYTRRGASQKDMRQYPSMSSYDLSSAGWRAWPHVMTTQALALVESRMPETMLADPQFGRLETLDHFLTPVVMDLILRRELVESDKIYNEHRLKAMDEATRVLLTLQTGSVTIPAVFAASILYDVGMMDLAQPYSDLCEFARASHGQVSYSIKSPENPEPTGYFWAPGESKFNKITDACKQFVLGEVPFWARLKAFAAGLQPASSFKLHEEDVEIMSRCMSGIGVGKQEQIERLQKLALIANVYHLPDQDATRIWNGNPIFCGTMMQNIAVAREQSGICLAKHHLSIFEVAYLYAASKAQGLIHGQWLQLEQVIEMHLGSMFFGSVPQTPTQFFSVFMMRSGLPLSKLRKTVQYKIKPRGGDRTGKLPFMKATVSCLSISDTTHVFASWLDGTSSFIQTLYSVKNLLANTQHHKLSHGTVRSQIDPLTFLEPFCQHVTNKSERMSIDYIGLVHECSDMLQALLDKNIIRLRDQPDDYKAVGDPSLNDKKKYTKSYNSLFYRLIEQILWEDKEWEQAQAGFKKLRKAGGDVKRVSWIGLAGQWCQQYLSERRKLSMAGTTKTPEVEIRLTGRHWTSRLELHNAADRVFDRRAMTDA